MRKNVYVRRTKKNSIVCCFTDIKALWAIKKTSVRLSADNYRCRSLAGIYVSKT